jgi:tetratricopeptide (TPR) repeat protein
VTERAHAQQWRDGRADGLRTEEEAGEPVRELDNGALSGEAYDWYQRGLQLLDGGNPAAAAQLLVRVANREPRSRSVLEALARAQFDAEQHEDAADTFRTLAEANPDDDYAQFGWGLAAARLGQYETAVEHLALAAAMRPDVRFYTQALRGARATVRSRGGSNGGSGRTGTA